MASGCDSVGKAVDFNTKVLQFKASHQHNVIQNMYFLLFVEKTKIMKMSPEIGHFERIRQVMKCLWHSGQSGRFRQLKTQAII